MLDKRLKKSSNTIIVGKSSCLAPLNAIVQNSRKEQFGVPLVLVAVRQQFSPGVQRKLLLCTRAKLRPVSWDPVSGNVIVRGEQKPSMTSSLAG